MLFRSVRTSQNDLARYAPFSTPWHADLVFTVKTATNTEIDYSSHAKVTYSLGENSDPRCAAVDGDAGEAGVGPDDVYVKPDAPFSCAVINVTACIDHNGLLGCAWDTVEVVRVTSLTTAFSAYPAGSSGVSELFLLPCSESAYERAQAASTAVQTNMATSVDYAAVVFTTQMTYVSSNTTRAAFQGSVGAQYLVASGPGLVTTGAIEQANNYHLVNASFVIVTEASVDVSALNRTTYTFTGEWTLASLADDTLAKEVNGTEATYLHLTYTSGGEIGRAHV